MLIPIYTHLGGEGGSFFEIFGARSIKRNRLLILSGIEAEHELDERLGFGLQLPA